MSNWKESNHNALKASLLLTIIKLSTAIVALLLQCHLLLCCILTTWPSTDNPSSHDYLCSKTAIEKTSRQFNNLGIFITLESMKMTMWAVEAKLQYVGKGVEKRNISLPHSLLQPEETQDAFHPWASRAIPGTAQPSLPPWVLRQAANEIKSKGNAEGWISTWS